MFTRSDIFHLILDRIKLNSLCYILNRVFTKKKKKKIHFPYFINSFICFFVSFLFLFYDDELNFLLSFSKVRRCFSLKSFLLFLRKIFIFHLDGLFFSTSLTEIFDNFSFPLRFILFGSNSI